MKKFLLSIAILAAAYTAHAEGSGWYFVYDGNGWKIDASTEFQKTDSTDVFILTNYEVTSTDKGGFNYQVTNKDWSKMYGWCEEADGNDVVGTTYQLGSVGNAWINCESGKYDITFNHAKETILFAVPSSNGITDITNDNTELQYYSISGLPIDADHLSTGIYIRRQGNKVSKILVK